jgi:hypothetical protein
VRIVWDRNNQRIPDALQVRQKPNLAAMDGGWLRSLTSDTAATSTRAPTSSARARPHLPPHQSGRYAAIRRPRFANRHSCGRSCRTAPSRTTSILTPPAVVRSSRG